VLVNLIIIYFACGSPIGVYRITRAAHLRSPRQAASVGAYFILWPIFAPAILRRSLLVREANIEQALSIIRSAIEKIAFVGSQTIPVFEFREIFARYTGLTLALNAGGAPNFSADLFKVSKHGNLALATACLNRRNRQRLSFHQMQARREFVDMVARMARSHTRGTEIVELGLQLTHLLNDQHTAGDFARQRRFTKSASL